MFDSDYKISGIYATYLMDLCKRQRRKDESEEEYKKDNFKIFNTYMDCYLVATMLGIRYGKVGKLNDPDNKDSAGMMSEKINKKSNVLKYLYQIAMLCDKERNLTEEERLENAFQLSEYNDDGSINEENAEKIKGNLDLFEQYFFGGLEMLHEEFVEKCTTDEDYLERIHSFVKEYAEEIQSLEDDKE